MLGCRLYTTVHTSLFAFGGRTLPDAVTRPMGAFMAAHPTRHRGNIAVQNPFSLPDSWPFWGFISCHNTAYTAHSNVSIKAEAVRIYGYQNDGRNALCCLDTKCIIFRRCTIVGASLVQCGWQVCVDALVPTLADPLSRQTPLFGPQGCLDTSVWEGSSGYT